MTRSQPTPTSWVRIAVVVCAASGVMWGCSGSGPNSPSGGTGGTSLMVGTYVGTLTVPGSAGLGGMLLLTKSSGSVFAIRMLLPQWLTRLRDVAQPTLHAQSSSASGTLITDAGPSVQLSGTFAGNTFTMSGGGYSITAIANGTSITGSGSAPGGASAQVTPAGPPSGTIPPSQNAEGKYHSQFHIDAPFTLKIVRGTGAVDANCSVMFSIDGTMTVEVLAREKAFLLVSWTERAAGAPTGYGCPPFPVHSFGPAGIDYVGPLDTLVFATREVWSQGTLTGTRTQAFVGALSGTTILGTYWKSLNLSGPMPGVLAQTYNEGYANSNTPMTLTR